MHILCLLILTNKKSSYAYPTNLNLCPLNFVWKTLDYPCKLEKTYQRHVLHIESLMFSYTQCILLDGDKLLSSICCQNVEKHILV